MSILAQVPGLPGMRAATSVDHRVVTRGGPVPIILPVGKTIAGACTRDTGNTSYVDRVRAGMIMGKISSVVNSLGAVGDYANSILGVTTNAEAAGSTSIQAAAAVVTELVRRCGSSGTFKLTGPPSAGGVVVTETVTYSAASSTNITVTAITNAFVAGSFIQPTDGSETPLSFLPNGAPLRMTDHDNNNIQHEWPGVPLTAIVDSSQLIFWPSDTSLQSWLVNRLNDAAGGKFIFDHVF